jgi:hypothetical protein
VERCGHDCHRGPRVRDRDDRYARQDLDWSVADHSSDLEPRREAATVYTGASDRDVDTVRARLARVVRHVRDRLIGAPVHAGCGEMRKEVSEVHVWAAEGREGDSERKVRRSARDATGE